MCADALPSELPGKYRYIYFIIKRSQNRIYFQTCSFYSLMASMNRFI